MNSIDKYKQFLNEFMYLNIQVALLRDYQKTVTPGVLVGIRHDIDHDIFKAHRIARAESDKGIHATYFVLHTAKYYSDNIFPLIREIQDMGHEIGFHNDLYTLKVLKHENMENVLNAELDKFKKYGIDIVGTAAHGSQYRHKYRYNNLDVWKEIDMTEYFQYEAYYLNYDKYYSDCSNGWQYDMPDLDAGDRAMFLAHPRRVK